MKTLCARSIALGVEATKQRQGSEGSELAEREGFEPPVPFQVQRFSRPPLSTAQPPLRTERWFSLTPAGLLRFGDHLKAAHERAQRLWHLDRSIRLLVVLQNRNQCPAHREA